MNRIRFARIALCCFVLMGGLTLPTVAQPGRLTGSIKGLGNKPVIFRYTQKGVQKRDTVMGVNDRFSYQPKPSDDGLISLFISYPRYTSFWYEPGNLTVAGAIDKPYKLTITGTKENDVYNQYHQTIDWVYDDKEQGKSAAFADSLAQQKSAAILSFIAKYPTAKTSAYLLYWETIVNQKDVVAYDRLLQMLSPDVKASFQGKEAGKRIYVLQNQPITGRKAPNFSLADTTGAVASLASYKGRYVLLDFWGHWCGPCLRAFPKLKAIQEKYAGKLVLIGIAAEFADDKSNWSKAIKKFDANWLQLSELAGDKGSVNEQYNITAFPTYLLLDKEGTVVERALDVETIERKLGSLGNF